MNQSSRKRGIRNERILVNKIYEQGYSVIRSPASGGATKRELPDIVCGNGINMYGFELKSTVKDKLYLRIEQVSELRLFCKNFRAKPFIVYKKPYKPFIFIPLNKLKLSRNKKSYPINCYNSVECCNYYFLFEDLF